MFDLTGKIAIVTGGNGGLGLGYGRGLVKCGAKVAVWGRNQDKNANAVDELRSLGGEVEAFTCDVTKEADIATAFDRTLDQFGAVDACFANAGGGGYRGLSHQTSRTDWLSTIDLNLMSVVQTWAPVTDHMLERGKGGRLIVTSSIAAYLGTAGSAGYSTTKAAVLGLVRALALELGHAGIRVNAILPGFIETEMSAQAPALREAAKRRTAIARMGELEDVEGIAVFLASQHSDFITGQSIVLDGGHTLHPL